MLIIKMNTANIAMKNNISEISALAGLLLIILFIHL